MVLRPAEALHPLAVGAAARIDIMGDGGGANEAHAQDGRVVEDGVHCLLVAVDDLQNSVRQTGFLQQFRQHQRH